MQAILPYLTFNGTCREAMTFYAAALEKPAHFMTYSECGQTDPAVADHIMHCHLTDTKTPLMASDAMPGKPAQPGTNFTVSVSCDTSDEQDRFFSGLSEGGTITMPLQQTFWGARFGMLTDTFGIQWMFNLDTPGVSADTPTSPA